MSKSTKAITVVNPGSLGLECIDLGNLEQSLKTKISNQLRGLLLDAYDTTAYLLDNKIVVELGFLEGEDAGIPSLEISLPRLISEFIECASESSDEPSTDFLALKKTLHDGIAALDAAREAVR